MHFLFFFFFFAFYVLALRAQTRPAMEFGSGEEGLRPESYYIEFPFLVYLFTDTRKNVNAPGLHCGAEGRWRPARSACERYVRCAVSVCSLCLIMFSFPQCRLIIDPAGSVGPSGTGCDSDWKLVLGSAWLQPGPDTQLGGTPSVWSCLFPRVRRLLRSSPLFLLSSPLLSSFTRQRIASISSRDGSKPHWPSPSSVSHP